MYILQIHPFTKEVPMSVPPDYEDVFNDTSVHTFPASLLQDMKPESWEDHCEPTYDEDAEIIFNQNLPEHVT